MTERKSPAWNRAVHKTNRVRRKTQTWPTIKQATCHSFQLNRELIEDTLRHSSQLQSSIAFFFFFFSQKLKSQGVFHLIIKEFLIRKALYVNSQLKNHFCVRKKKWVRHFVEHLAESKHLPRISSQWRRQSRKPSSIASHRQWVPLTCRRSRGPSILMLVSELPKLKLLFSFFMNSDFCFFFEL